MTPNDFWLGEVAAFENRQAGTAVEDCKNTGQAPMLIHAMLAVRCFQVITFCCIYYPSTC